MKLGPVTKLEKKNTVISKKSDDSVISEFMTSLSLFGFIANLKQFRSRRPDVLSVSLTFSLTVTFCLTKSEDRTKESLTQLSN